MRGGSLFSGVDGFGLGLERALDLETVWHVEISDFCRDVLAKHWPNAERFTDVREAGRHNLADVEIIWGGFPCQDLSHANTRARAGLCGSQSGLWTEYRRIVSELFPRFVVVENIAAGWRRWVPVVRRDLHELGYASMPIQLRACDVGAPFAGSRVFVLAAADADGESTRALHAQVALLPSTADACREDWGNPSARALGVADGTPRRMDRLGAIGNAVVPQCAQVIGEIIRRIM